MVFTDPASAGFPEYRHLCNELDHERGDQPGQEQHVPQVAPPQAANTQQRQQRLGERIGEGGQRRQGTYPVALRIAAFGEPVLRDGDGHEQQADQRTGHAGAAEEEVFDVVRSHPCSVVYRAQSTWLAAAAYQGRLSRWC